MKLFILTLFITLTGLNMKAQHIDLDDLKWKKRIVIIKHNKEVDILNSKQTTLFLQNEAQNSERDLVIFTVDSTTVYLGRKETKENPLHFWKQTGLKKTFEGIVLIGKDGGVKLKEPFLIEPQKIYDLIDSMPMRRREMDKN
ncbi:DUF4174 domain-containing protein [Galbibacter mesophilus]|uniref:DUF4174 domain-containing protein n=1 Tax=Galbibacter mesophilus TaxID=379069 RepID=UPI00191F47EF|nr:DUF4174 domain-containing protein [Galbibacter mesophilus]MCM5661590.1 DUF4174 domain-containing protein [Galbibacter mesophilus]